MGGPAPSLAARSPRGALVGDWPGVPATAARPVSFLRSPPEPSRSPEAPRQAGACWAQAERAPLGPPGLGTRTQPGPRPERAVGPACGPTLCTTGWA